MKLLVSAKGTIPDSQVSLDFARSPWFLAIDTETMECEALENTLSTDPECTAIAAADLLIDKLVREQFKAVLTGEMGPNASRIFWEAGIPVTTGLYGIVKDVVLAFIRRGVVYEPVSHKDVFRSFVEKRAEPAGTGRKRVRP